MLTISNTSVVFIPENKWFEYAFDLHIDNEEHSFNKDNSCGRIKTEYIEGILFRPFKTWYPSHKIDDMDKSFIYSETMAANFGMLHSLGIPIINKFDIGWWLNDPTYELQILKSLASILSIPYDIDFIELPLNLTRHNQTIAHNLREIYVIGDYVTTPYFHQDEMYMILQKNIESISLWQKEKGIIFSRIVYERSKLKLKFVDVMPDFANGHLINLGIILHYMLKTIGKFI